MQSKEPLLFLCHRIPFPPNKGDKIRSFNMLKALSEHFDVYLGTFVDDPYDWQYVDTLDKYCAGKLVLGQNKTLCKLKGLSAFLSGKAISIPYYSNARMQQWVNKTLKDTGASKVFVYSSVMAQFVNDKPGLQQVVDFVDVDSDKWRQYADGKTGISRWVYSREHRTLQRFETETAKRATANLFVSPQEAGLFQSLVDTAIANKTFGVLNGVDTDFFSPEQSLPALGHPVDVVFTGAMDYWANVDAVLWFSQQVWPLVRQRHPEARFYIVGGNPTQQVQALNGRDGIVVTGRVKDVRPYIAESRLAVAPLQIARGIQNKVLEAMAMAKPVVATSMAIEGIESDSAAVAVTDEPQRFAAQVSQWLNEPMDASENRTWIMQNLQWSATLADLAGFFDRK